MLVTERDVEYCTAAGDVEPSILVSLILSELLMSPERALRRVKLCAVSEIKRDLLVTITDEEVRSYLSEMLQINVPCSVSTRDSLMSPFHSTRYYRDRKTYQSHALHQSNSAHPSPYKPQPRPPTAPLPPETSTPCQT